MPLSNGESEFDTVVIRMPDYGIELKGWTSFTFNRTFLQPTADWSFTFGEGDMTLTQELLVEGAAVEVSINGAVQCTGFIEDVDDDSGENGTTTTVKCGDILNQVVKGTMDPAFKFPAGITLPSFVLSVLDPFGITVVFNSDDANIFAMTGFRPGQAGSTSVQIKADIPLARAGSVTVERTDTRTEIVSNTRRDLAKLALQQVKPHAGEGCYAYIDRILKRLGFCMWATAGGEGVVIDAPNYTQPANYSFIRSRSEPSKNNIRHGRRARSRRMQPSLIVAFGFGGGCEFAKTRLKCIAVNELTGLDDNGNFLPGVQEVINRYKGAQVLPLRPQLVPNRKPLGDRGTCVPLFLKDDESKTPEQLAAFVRREMAKRQMAAQQVTYEVEGHSQGGHVFATNTQASVEDDVFNIHKTMWIHSVSFANNPTGGTTSSIKLLPQYTLAIGA